MKLCTTAPQGQQRIPQTPAVAAEGAVEEHDEEVVQEDDEKGQAADGEELLDSLPVQPLPADGQGCFPSEEDGEDVGQDAHLRQNGSQSGPSDAHVQAEEEQRVQHRVHHRPQQDGRASPAVPALAPEGTGSCPRR